MYCDFACFTAITHFVANDVKFCKNDVRGSSRLITVLHTGVGGGGWGSGQFITILHGGTPILLLVLRNI